MKKVSPRHPLLDKRCLLSRNYVIILQQSLTKSAYFIFAAIDQFSKNDRNEEKKMKSHPKNCIMVYIFLFYVVMQIFE